MGEQTPLAVQLAPSIIAALALLLAAAVTYFLTTRLEHRKWLRDQRLEAYDRYVLRLWKMSNAANGSREMSDEERQESALIADRIHLVGSAPMRRLVAQHRNRLADAVRSGAGIQGIMLEATDEFRAQARRDLGSGGKTS